MRSKEQERMSIAYEFVESVKNKEIEEKYASLVKKLPAMIVHNGLLATLAFLKAKSNNGKENEHSLLLKHILEYLKKANHLKDSKYDNFIQLVKTESFTTERYLHITREVLNFTVWLKRIAEGELKDDEQA